MKKIYSYALAIGVSLMTLAACSDFLEVQPRTQVSETEFYKTEDEMMKGLYNVMWEVKTRLLEIHDYSCILSDEAETGGGLGEGQWKTKWDTFSYNATSSFGQWGYGSWWNEWDFGIYNGVIAANILIDKLNSCSLDDSFVKPLKAEASFFRALFYDYLFMGYEQFPLIKGILSADQMYSVPKGTRDEIYDFMMSDLSDENIAALPARASVQQGRICADAARVLRAKVILFHRDEKMYPKALDDMKTIINSGVYTLDPDYLHLWLKDGEWGTESIYEVSAGSTNDTGMGFVHGLGGRNLVDPRSAEEGGLLEGYGQCTMPSTVYNMFEEGDTRREGTCIVYADEAEKVAEMVTSGALPEGSTFIVSDQQENYEGLGHYKYHPRKESTGSINPSSNHATAFRFYRYADVLLLGVELEARINGTVSDAGQHWFDLVRDRAFGDKNHRITLAGKSKQELLDIIFKERGYEFMDEMQRWFDILRFDKGTEILGSKGWTEKYRYFPIDQSEIDRTNGLLTQNPGWID